MRSATFVDRITFQVPESFSLIPRLVFKIFGLLFNKIIQHAYCTVFQMCEGFRICCPVRRLPW